MEINFFAADLLVVFLLLFKGIMRAKKKAADYFPEDDGIVWNLELANKMGGIK